MRPTRYVKSTAGNGDPIVLDIYDRSQVSLQVDVTGTIEYTVQQTMDNVFDASITPTWTNHPDPSFVNAITDQAGGWPYTPFAVRLVIDSVAGGSAAMTVLSGSFD